ncbi:MAG: PAS domain-containing protein, partial [Pseudomonadota bacterium]|nr:PAS domain-containing protein [Pseudomonadota bacterium]
MRAHDWSSHPLGVTAQWPQPLRLIVRLMLDSKFPMFVAWGPELRCLYNESFIAILADRQARALGEPLREVWADIWNAIEPLVDRALAGEPTWLEDQPFVLNRHGRDDTAWFTFSYSPARDDSGRVAGMFGSVVETTERVRVHAALRDRELRFERIADSIDQMVWSTRPDGHHDYYNRRWYEFTGVPQGSTDGDAWAGLFHVEDQARAWAAWRHCLATGEPYFIEYRLRHRSGAFRWVLGRAQPVRAEDGQIARWYGTCTDIQAIVDAREVLSRSRADLERLVTARTAERDRAWRNAPGLLILIDAEGVIASVNPGWTTALGWAEGELLGRLFAGFIHPDDLALSRAALAAAATRHAAQVTRFRCREGGHCWVSWKASRSDGTTVVVGRDVTEEKRRNEALLLHQNIVQSHSSPICAFDPAHRVVAFNRAHSEAFERMWDHRAAIGESLPAFFPPDQAKVLKACMNRALQGESFTVVESYGDPQFEMPCFEVSYYPLRDEHGQVVGAFLHAIDITLRLRAQAELEAAQAALRQAQKMEAVGQLTGGLAHDFNNLLAGITGSLEVIGRKLAKGQTGDLQRFIAMAQGGARRAAGLTHRLLAFSSRQTLDPKSTDVQQLVDGMEELIGRTVGPSIELEVVHGPGLWPSLIDANQLELAVLNLAINARDAMPEGGKLGIRTENRWMDLRAAAECGLEPGPYVAVSVSDTGTGMSPDVVSRAFDPFFTTKPIGMGTGLGLSMIHGFARQSGGSVHIESTVGSGSVVSIYLPRHQGAPGLQAPTQAALPFASASGHSVLVVDDEANVRAVVAESLRDIGFAVLEAEDGPSALRTLQSAASIDLLVTDVGLPGGLNGRQVADA